MTRNVYIVSCPVSYFSSNISIQYRSTSVKFMSWYTDNAALYSKVGVPFVMGTTGGDRELLYKTVGDSNVYAVISPQMGKQVLSPEQLIFCSLS